ncbi:FGGY-family carbohydrate kinase [Peteryoungia ipomoeae]|uniref:Ribulokinase n=1 Tax=Peteryoungia ipomoeae TaxID=1210932 RepID=A0A4S8NXI2_9HYPH|nr:FGGY-family carbohydrate kinase [Peteryoungia ipomoeae]THV21012.1 ribulokinase [Peteryoungia ipomoeae]
MRDHVIAVDVGTGSARAGVVDRSGRLLARSEHPLVTHVVGEEVAEQSSEQIWAAVCMAVRAAVQASGVAPADVAGISFDATCSLVLRDTSGASIPLTHTDRHSFDTILWMDHRAIEEARICTETGHRVIRHAGNSLSPEMQIPKLLWLKTHRPDLWSRLGFAFDLADFLTWRASGSNERSICTLTSKWGYLHGEPDPWPTDFLAEIGLSDLLEKCGLSASATPVGKPVGTISTEAAKDLGLMPGIAVAAGMVDAYAGTLGVLGGQAGKGADALTGQYALIGGTSSCVVAFSREPLFQNSVWGPYFETVFPNCWLSEAGQSATGALLNHLVAMHSAGGEATVARHRAIIDRVQELRTVEGHRLAEDINILPDFHGNRSPFADPTLTGIVTGMRLDQSFDGLCRLYWRACLSIALGLRQVIETMQAGTAVPARLYLTGGHVKNALLNELYGDVSGCEVVIPQTDDAVLIGTAMNAATAAGLYPDLSEAGAAMAPNAVSRAPKLAVKGEQYDRDYQRFQLMQEMRLRLRDI